MAVDQRGRWSNLRVLLVLVGVAFVLDFVFFTGYFASDDYGYLMGGRALVADGVFTPTTGTARLGMTLPIALVYWLTGGSIAAIAWVHVGYHLSLVVLTYVLGRLVHDDKTGLVAAAIVATSPLLYVFAGAVLPDNAAACWVMLALIALAYVQRRVPLGEGLLGFHPRRFLLHVLAGALLGIAWMCKETGLIMTIPAAVFVMSAAPLRNLAWIQNGAAMVLGLGAMLVLDAFLLRELSGGWVLRHQFLTNAETSAALVQSMSVEGTTALARFAGAKALMVELLPVTTWLLLAGSIAYAVTRKRSLGVMASFWWPLIYLTIGTVSIRAYVPLPIQARYYAVAIPPAALMTASAILTGLAWWQEAGRATKLRRYAPALLVVVAVYTGARELRANAPLAGNIYHAGEARALVTALELAQERYPRQPVVLSPYLWNRMEPLVFRARNVRPPSSAWWMAPPYVYIEQTQAIDEHTRSALETPYTIVTRVADVAPSRGRLAVLAHSLRQAFSVTRKPHVAQGSPSEGVAIFAITKR